MISETEHGLQYLAEAGPPDYFAILMGALLSPGAIAGSACLQQTMKDHGLGLTATRSLLKDPRALVLLEMFAEDPDSEQLRSAAAEILTIYPMGTLSDDLQSRIPRQYTPATMRVNPFDKGWALCSSSERLLEGSLKSVVIVNGYLAVKYNGHQTALALSSLSTRQGTFLEGCWYSPTDETTRRAIDEVVSSEPSHLYIEKSSWAYMRPARGAYLQMSSREFLEGIRQTLRPEIYA